MLKRSHEKFKISILVYRFLVWIWLGGQDSDSLYQHTAYALHTAHNNPTFNQEKFKSNINEHFTDSVFLSQSLKVNMCLVSTDRMACPGRGWVRRGRRCRDASGARPHRRVQTPGYSGVEIVRILHHE